MKYYSPQTDYSALERELTGTKSGQAIERDRESAESEEYSDYEDPYDDEYTDER